MRTPVIAGNWKMNLLRDDAVALARDVASALDGSTGVEVVVCPVFTVLSSVAEAFAGGSVEVGGQNCYGVESGAFTGEISPQMLRDAGCAWTIIGHSERRQIFNESDALLNKKLHFALASGLKVMFCIGETLEERESGAMNDVLRRQVIEGLKGLDDTDFTRVVLAYEPVWAIGTGVTATPGASGGGTRVYARACGGGIWWNRSGRFAYSVWWQREAGQRGGTAGQGKCGWRAGRWRGASGR